MSPSPGLTARRPVVWPRASGISARQGQLVILATHDVLLPTDLIATAVSLRDGRLAGTQSGRVWATALRAGVQGDR